MCIHTTVVVLELSCIQARVHTSPDHTKSCREDGLYDSIYSTFITVKKSKKKNNNNTTIHNLQRCSYLDDILALRVCIGF